MKARRHFANAWVFSTLALALAIPLYVAPRDDRRDRSAYVGWLSGDYAYEASARFLGWRFSVRFDVPRRSSISISDPASRHPYATLNGPGSYPSDGGFGAGFDSYPVGSWGEVLGEQPQWLGFGGGPFAPPGTPHRVFTAWVPVWFVVAALALPAVRRAVRRHRTLRRVRGGRCVACGYDLRGAAHDRCPECGSDALAHSP